MSAPLSYPTDDTKQTAMNDNLRNLDQPNHMCHLSHLSHLSPQNDTQRVDGREGLIPNGSCIVFLDFNSVTHPEPCKGVNYFCHLPLIEVVLREYPAVDIVISSSWRDPELHSLDDLRGFLSPDIAARVVGVVHEGALCATPWASMRRRLTTVASRTVWAS